VTINILHIANYTLAVCSTNNDLSLATFADERRNIDPDGQDRVWIWMNIDGQRKLDVTGFILVHASRIHSIRENFHLRVRHVDWKATQLQHTGTEQHS